MTKQMSELIIVDEAKQVQEQDVAERVNAILQRDYNDFLMTKKFVLKNLHKLKGKTYPVETMSITNLPSHDCIILNDLILLPYHEVADEIAKIIKEEKLDERDKGTI